MGNDVYEYGFSKGVRDANSQVKRGSMAKELNGQNSKGNIMEHSKPIHS